MEKGTGMKPEKQFESVIAELEKDPHITQSRMFGSPGLKIEGKVFAMLVKGKLVVKLPRDRVETLVKAGEGKYFDPGHGKLMKEWVAISSGTKRKWLNLVEEAKDFVSSLR